MHLMWPQSSYWRVWCERTTIPCILAVDISEALEIAPTAGPETPRPWRRLSIQVKLLQCKDSLAGFERARLTGSSFAL